MLQGVGPMSGTSYDNAPPNCYAMNNRRPHRAENFRPADREQPRAPVQQPPLFFHQPESRIANSVITTTLAGLVKLSKNPKFPKFVDACDDLFSPNAADAQQTLEKIGSALNLVAAQENIAFICSSNGEQLPAQGGGEFFHTGAGIPNQPSAGIGHPSAGINTPTAGMFQHPIYIEPLDCIPAEKFNSHDIPIVQLLTPAMQIAEAFGQFAEVAINQVPTIFIPTASMPEFKFAFMKPAVSKDTKPTQFSTMAVRTGHFDTGCSVNLMSAKAYAANQHLFSSTQIKGIRPFRINMADGRSHTMTMRVVEDVIMCMDKAFYISTFLIIDNLAIDYLIGWAFMLQYDVQLKPARSQYAIGIPRDNVLDPMMSGAREYQLLPLSFKTKRMTLVVAP
eukprot:jgi/Botrbrau1/10452/Bobra.0133s0059.1